MLSLVSKGVIMAGASLLFAMSQMSNKQGSKASLPLDRWSGLTIQSGINCIFLRHKWFPDHFRCDLLYTKYRKVDPQFSELTFDGFISQIL
jgi:hypothetical protein